MGEIARTKDEIYHDTLEDISKHPIPFLLPSGMDPYLSSLDVARTIMLNEPALYLHIHNIPLDSPVALALFAAKEVKDSVLETETVNISAHHVLIRSFPAGSHAKCGDVDHNGIWRPYSDYVVFGCPSRDRFTSSDFYQREYAEKVANANLKLYLQLQGETMTQKELIAILKRLAWDPTNARRPAQGSRKYQPTGVI